MPRILFFVPVSGSLSSQKTDLIRCNLEFLHREIYGKAIRPDVAIAEINKVLVGPAIDCGLFIKLDETPTEDERAGIEAAAAKAISKGLCQLVDLGPDEIHITINPSSEANMPAVSLGITEELVRLPSPSPVAVN